MSINFRGISSQPAKPSVPVFHGSIDNSSAFVHIQNSLLSKKD